LARLTRHELKEHSFQTAYEEYEHFVKEHYREISVVVGAVLVIVGLVLGLRYLMNQQEAAANAQLGDALETFHGYVGTPAPGTLGPDAKTFPTAKEKYTKALSQFSAMMNVSGFQKLLPQQKAIRIARYHVGLCQAELGDEAGAIKTLNQVVDDRDPDIASLARFALAEQLAKTGKTSDAVKIFQNLVDHPTTAVPKATAQLALADALRDTQPAAARRIYEGMERDYAAEADVVESVKQQIASLPK